MPVERFLDRLGGAAAVLVDFAEPGHRLVRLVEPEPFGAGDAQAVAPFARVAVGTRDRQPMQYGEIDRPLDIEAEAPVGEQAGEHVAASGFGPQPAEHQIGSDADAAQFRQLAAIEARQHDRPSRMPRRRGDQPVDQAGGFDLVAPAERLDDALNVAPALACVLDEVEVLIGSDLLDADEHGAAPCLRQGHHDSSPLLKINKPSQSQKYRSFSTTMRAVSSQPQHFCDPQRPHHPKPRKLGQADSRHPAGFHPKASH